MYRDPIKILVAVDGSDQSFDAVRYVAHICNPDRTHLVLFNVLSKAAESYWDNHETAYSMPVGTPSQWEAQQEQKLRIFMHNAKELLFGCGFDRDHVTVNIQSRREGIARDIIRESAAGYDAVVAGRVGTNPIARLVMGSVAAKLIVSLTRRPLWLVDGQPDGGRVLVAIDASRAAMDVVAHVGKVLIDTTPAITLFHVMRNPDGGSDVGSEIDAEVQRGAKAALAPIFERAYEILENTGISKDRISAKLVSGVATRAGTIFAQALHGQFGTIAIGRRGFSQIDKFPLGRVTNKIVQLVNDMAVWIVS